MISQIMKRKLSPDPHLDPENNNVISIRWGQKTGEINCMPMKTYVPNPKIRKNTLDNEKRKLTRMQILSCIIQLEQKNYIECPKKGCRCISMSPFEIADHIVSCEGSKSNRLLKLCKYCPHGTVTTKSLSNHVVVSHPHAAEYCLVYDNSVNDALKTKFLTSDDFKQTIKNLWRIHLESKGCIMCLIPCCHYVTGLISQMEVHFLMCGPDVWQKLSFNCNKCAGRTFDKEELDGHFEDCHDSEITYNCCDDRLREFWELTLRAFEVSKCVSKNCKFIAHNLLSLEKHYRYCRNPREDNFEICGLCGGWFDNAYDLWSHETRFHVIGRTNHIKKLMSIDVNDPGPWLKKKKTQSSETQAIPKVKKSKKLYFKDVVLNKTSFLGELAKTIETESNHNDNDQVNARITIENQFSWSLKVPNLNTATDVVARRLPSYSVKKIMAESIEDGAELLRLSETVSRITCHPSKSYIPPRPLDFVLDRPNVLSRLRKKFVPRPPASEKISLESFVQKKGKVQDKSNGKAKEKSNILSDKTEETCAKKSRNKTHEPETALKPKSGVKEGHSGIKTLLPVKLPPSRFNSELDSGVSVTFPSIYIDGSNETSLNYDDSYNQANVVLRRGRKPNRAKESLSKTPILPKRPEKVINLKAPLQYPSAKSRLASMSPGVPENPRLASILLKTDGKMQIPSTLKLVRVVPRSKLNTVKPKTPLEPPTSVVAIPIEDPSPIVQSDSSGIEGICSSVGTPDRTKYLNGNSHSYLEMLPSMESVVVGQSNPISDNHHGIDSQSLSDNLHKTGRFVRTYGRNCGSSRTSNNRLLTVGNAVGTDEDVPGTEKSGLFTDEMAVDHHDSVEDPLNIGSAEPDVKTEPVDDYENYDEYDGPSVMFHDSYDIFMKVEEKEEEECTLSYPYDATIPFDVICESTEAVSGGLYNNQCPWEQAQKKNKSDRNLNKLLNKNPYRSKNLLANVRDPLTPTLFGNEITSLTGSARECNLVIPDPNGVIENGAHFVNEPMIYTVGDIIYDSSSKLCDLRTIKMESNKPTCGQSYSMDVAEEGRNSSNLFNSHMINNYGGLENHVHEFLDLVYYLTHFNERHFVNEAMVYAVDKIVYDNQPKIASVKKDGTGSKSKKERRASSGEQKCSENSSGLQVCSSDQSISSSKSDEVSEKSKASRLPTMDQDEGSVFENPKRKRKSTASKLRKDLNDDDISLEESAKALLSLSQNKGPDEGGSAIDKIETNIVGIKSDTSTNLEELTVNSKMTRDEQCKTSDVERPGSATDPVTLGGKRTTRKSTRLVENSVFVDQEGNESLETKTTRKKRSSRKVLNIHAVEEIAPGVIVPVPQEENESDEERPPKRRGRPPKRKSRAVLKGINVPKSSFGLDNQSGGPRSPESMLYIAGDDDPESNELVPADQRLIFSSPLVDPHKLVECAVCGDSMTAAVYKKEHVVIHNHLCWLKGEEPMDLEDEKGVERFLYRIYLKTRAPFVCEICGVSKKSALGFVTHRKFCGKSAQERKELMVSCNICSRVLLPSSLHNHMIKSHPAIASVPEEPPLEGRMAASKCLDVLSTNVKDIMSDLEFIDENEELQAAEKNTWIRQVYAFCKRRIQKDQRSIIEEAAQGSQLYRCVITSCDFSDRNIINVIEHYRACDREPLDCRCKECPFMTNRETRMINHIRMNHFNKAKEYASKKFKSCEMVDVSEVGGGAFIPYIKSGELGSRSMLYLQPALYWTRDLRAEHFSMNPLFLHLDISGDLKLEKNEELAPYLLLRDESVRIKANDASSSWSVLKKFTSESFNDDVRLLYTGGIVRAFDWFPSSSSQYLAVSVGSFDSENISAAPVHSGPGHFQIWSTGTLDNLRETYEADPRLYLTICHDFGEIWDIECCPSGGLTDKRLGLVAIGTSSGIVAVYAIPSLDKCSEERATRMEPVVILKLGIQKSYQVTKISWSKTKPHRFIAAGFTNGLVAVWDLTTTSTLLKSANTILPFKSFHPHLTIITALNFCPMNEYYIATGCAEKSSKFWNLHDTTYNHGEFTRGLVTDVAWLPHWMAALNSLDDNYTVGTTTVTLSSIRNFIYPSQPAVTQADSAGLSISVNNWLNTFVCGYDSGQIILSIARKFSQSYEDRRKVFNCLLNPRLHDFHPKSSEMVSCNSYSLTSERYGIIFNHNFHMNNQTKIKGNPCTDLQCFPLTPVNKVCWNPNPNSFLTLASGFHSGFIVISRVKLPTVEINLLKSIFEQFNTDEMP